MVITGAQGCAHRSEPLLVFTLHLETARAVQTQEPHLVAGFALLSLRAAPLRSLYHVCGDLRVVDADGQTVHAAQGLAGRIACDLARPGNGLLWRGQCAEGIFRPEANSGNA